MDIDAAFAYVKSEQPDFIHISGKTSTGKSIFASRLKEELGYKVIELDNVVEEAVIAPLQLKNRGQVFFEVYKGRNELEWINSFVSETQKLLEAYKEEGYQTVIDGAVANIVTLKELLAPFPGCKIIYLHPARIDTYKNYLTSRFKLTNSDYHAGLPIAFWELIPDSDFQQFCKDREITPQLSQAIEKYALLSQETSENRLRALKDNFKNILIVEV